MAMDMFIKIETIDGEAQDSKHKNEIDVLSWSWGSANHGVSGTGGGSGAGKVAMQDLSFTHYLDKASPKLALANWSGRHIPSAVLVMRKAGENPVEYLKYTFNDLIVSSVNTGGSGGEDRLVEAVTLNFSKVNMEYVEQDAKGGAKPAISAGWDVKQNMKA